MKRKFKGISLLVVILLVTTFISVKTSEASVSTQPNFTIQNLEATPNPAKVNEDIVVKGQVVPEDFETTIQPKEIVLVLDTSGSMAGNKIINLKEATKSFIESMKNVPNLKIGIVAYSTEATINPYEYNYGKKTIRSLDSDTYFEVQNYKSYNDSLLENNNEILGKVIDNIKPLGGTNTGEGLRKAIYMLDNGDKNVSKTIVLMSDGKPTYYSTYSNKSFYTEINNNYPEIAGTGSSTNNQTREYSNLIGKMIKEKGYNSYSIGYGITDGKDDFMKIHASMRGLSSTEEVNEANGFFEKSEGSITEIFNQIAKNIKASYDLNEVSLEIEFNQGFKLNIGGNEVNIGNITYNKVSESGGRIVYNAKPVNFSFIVKASEIGENQSMFNNLYVKFPWNNQKVRVNPKGELSIGIIPNDLPNIAAKLLSDKIIETKKGNEINIKYEIKPEDFKFNDINNSKSNDVVIVIDTSSNMTDKLNIVTDNIFNKIIDNNNLKNSKTEYDFITYSNDIKEVIDLKSSSYRDYQSYITDLNNNYLKTKVKTDTSNAKNINTTYKKIIELLDNGRAGAGKNVVFISLESNVSYKSDDLNILKEKGYNIITLAIKNDNNGNDKNYIVNLHKELKGLDENYFYANEKNEIGNVIMGKIAERLISGISYKGYELNPVIKLNLGNNFTAINGIDTTGTIKLPTITYNLTQNNNYHAESQIIEFTLKVNNLTSGTYGFGLKSDNTMTYSSLLGKNVVANLETPEIVIKYQVKDLVHGLYEGVENNKINIYIPLEGDKTTISPGATVTFGAKFITSNDDFELTLNGDSKFNQIKPSDIKVYKIDKTTNSLVEINRNFITITNLNDNSFTIKASNLNNKSEDTEIVIIYKGRIEENRENESFINSVKISDLNAEIRVKTGGGSNSNPGENEGDYQDVLPDLF